MEIGYFSLVLHAHLPFVRHPEHDSFLEEDWFFEAITETYIPLLKIFENFKEDNIPFRLTMSLTPTLLAMMSDPLLQTRYVRHIRRLIELAEKEIQRTRFDEALNTVAVMYLRRFMDCEDLFVNKYQRNLVGVFKKFQDSKNLEIITSGATHGYLPLLNVNPNTVSAQIEVAVKDYARYFNCAPSGIWLPECGYYPGLDEILKNYKLKYFFSDAHTIMYGQPRPTFGNFAPVRTPAGIHAFARDIEPSKMVWSREIGYPGDGYYREFYRDIGYEAEFDYIKPYICSDGNRKNTGIKYFRITDRSSHTKAVYEPGTALMKADAHADHFLSGRVSHVLSLLREMKKKPLIVSTYDAELFGHWWFEGPDWINFLFRKIASSEQIKLKLITPSEYLSENSTYQTITPTQSSWGDKGYHEFWLNPANDWIYPHLHEAANRMSEMAKMFASPDALQNRMLKQAARELLLAQSSDWAFIMKTGTMVSYAKARFYDHMKRFTKFYMDSKNNAVDEEYPSALEAKDNIFPDIDWRVYRQS